MVLLCTIPCGPEKKRIIVESCTATSGGTAMPESATPDQIMGPISSGPSPRSRQETEDGGGGTEEGRNTFLIPQPPASAPNQKNKNRESRRRTPIGAQASKTELKARSKAAGQ